MSRRPPLRPPGALSRVHLSKINTVNQEKINTETLEEEPPEQH
jgi:hypothetical protein